jgi:ABC-type bacteriocin/lantibiotic exporter with double-glycine peptidase domain
VHPDPAGAGERTLSRAELAAELGLAADARLEWLGAEAAEPCRDAQAPGGAPLAPYRRLARLLKPDRRDLLAIAAFAVAIGILQLATPVAVQALVNFVALGGAIQPVLIVALLLFVGLGFAATLTAVQAWIVEILQRRVFVRMVADLSARLPRVKLEALDKVYGPELLNRFFDIITLQKVGSYLLLDGLALLLSVLVGLVLLAFYHPVLLAFDIVLVAVIALVVLLPIRRGMATAIEESDAKYRTQAWLEEIGRNPLLFKSAGAQHWVLEVSDRLAGTYVARRARHYRVMLGQTIGALGLQVVASTALLAVGGILVIQGDLSLGQLVAAEIIVSLVVNAVAKMGKHLESFYDLMASTQKIGKLLDLPVEPRAGEHHAPARSAGGAALRVRNLACTRGKATILAGLSFELGPGECLCVSGPSGSGKSTLVQHLWGLRRQSAGSIQLDGRDLRELSLESLRRAVGVASPVEVVQASVHENVRLGRPFVSDEDVRAALEEVGLLDELGELPEGSATELGSTGQPLSEGQIRRLLVARAIAGDPRLLVVEDLLDQLSEPRRSRVLDALFARDGRWTLVVVSNSDDVRRRCDRVLHLPEGRVLAAQAQEAGA